ncbi:unnamed protein product [Cyclocybe aegerita]|uniref:Uncharacterized protein n=1 Tax=Cyclocybe aegerita TaxID=1973307 RepID=A0A8S0XIZ9_CYCAE|nr:unnamed protein product [Cyclocybe aegerita]
MAHFGLLGNPLRLYPPRPRVLSPTRPTLRRHPSSVVVRLQAIVLVRDVPGHVVALTVTVTVTRVTRWPSPASLSSPLATFDVFAVAWPTRNKTGMWDGNTCLLPPFRWRWRLNIEDLSQTRRRRRRLVLVVAEEDPGRCMPWAGLQWADDDDNRTRRARGWGVGIPSLSSLALIPVIVIAQVPTPYRYRYRRLGTASRVLQHRVSLRAVPERGRELKAPVRAALRPGMRAEAEQGRKVEVEVGGCRAEADGAEERKSGDARRRDGERGGGK